MTGWRKLLARAALVCGAFALSFLLAEVVLRVAGVAHPLFYVADPHTGAWHRPGVEGRWTAEGNAFVSINSRGLRDREHVLPKPAGVARIAVLGDSYAEALQVDADETFWSVAAQGVEACGGLGEGVVEPVNFGVSGFGTVQSLVTLRERVWEYDPEWVVLLFVPNDVRNNHRGLEGDPLRPYARPTPAGLVIDESFRDSDEYRYATSPRVELRQALTHHSRVLQVIDEVRRIRKRKRIRDAGRDSQDLVYTAPVDADWEEAWTISEAVLAELARDVRREGAHFLLVVATFGPQVHPDPEVRAAYQRDTPVTDFLYPEKRLRALGEREGFAVLTLAEPLRDLAEQTGECLHGFENAKPCGGHWNARGHRAAGERIAAYLCAEGAADASPSPSRL